jgi:signal transduction histidine kinase
LSHSRPASNPDLPALLHELHQPLTAILSNAQAAQRALADTLLERAQLHDILEDIIAEDKRAATIIKQLTQALEAMRAHRVETMEDGLPV